MIVKRTKHIASINVGESMLGRVIDPLGVPWTGAAKLAESCARCRWSVRHRGYLPSAGNGTAADGTEGYRCHDSYRPRTA